MARDKIHSFYNRHRDFPRNKPAEDRHRPADNSRHHEQGQRHGDHTSAPQFVEDGRAAHYTNDTSGWVRGCKSGTPTCHNEDATQIGKFDHGNSWKTDRATGMRDQIKDYRDADHRNHWTEYERSHNAGRTAAREFVDYSQRHIPKYERTGSRGIENSDLPKHSAGKWRE